MCFNMASSLRILVVTLPTRSVYSVFRDHTIMVPDIVSVELGALKLPRDWKRHCQADKSQSQTSVASCGVQCFNERYVTVSQRSRLYEFADDSIRDPARWLVGAVRWCTISCGAPGPRPPRLRMSRHTALIERGHATLRMTYNWRRLYRSVFGGIPSLCSPSALRVSDVACSGLI
jgi:hypothetical protein